MSSSGETINAGWAEQPPASVQWRVWPLGDRWYVGLGGLVALAVGVWFIYEMADAVHLAFLAGAALALAAWRFFVPIHYELNTDGVHQWAMGRRRRIVWSDIRRYETDRRGVLLLPFRDTCLLDATRGLYLPWTEKAEEVLTLIHFHLTPRGE